MVTKTEEILLNALGNANKLLSILIDTIKTNHIDMPEEFDKELKEYMNDIQKLMGNMMERVSTIMEERKDKKVV